MVSTWKVTVWGATSLYTSWELCKKYGEISIISSIFRAYFKRGPCSWIGFLNRTVKLNELIEHTVQLINLFIFNTVYRKILDGWSIINCGNWLLWQTTYDKFSLVIHSKSPNPLANHPKNDMRDIEYI